MNKQEEELNEVNRKKWNRMVDWYSTVGELCAFQGTSTLLSMARAKQCSNILEVACGTGTHSEIIA